MEYTVFINHEKLIVIDIKNVDIKKELSHRLCIPLQLFEKVVKQKINDNAKTIDIYVNWFDVRAEIHSFVQKNTLKLCNIKNFAIQPQDSDGACFARSILSGMKLNPNLQYMLRQDLSYYLSNNDILDIIPFSYSKKEYIEKVILAPCAWLGCSFDIKYVSKMYEINVTSIDYNMEYDTLILDESVGGYAKESTIFLHYIQINTPLIATQQSGISYYGHFNLIENTNHFVGIQILKNWDI